MEAKEELEAHLAMLERYSWIILLKQPAAKSVLSRKMEASRVSVAVLEQEEQEEKMGLKDIGNIWIKWYFLYSGRQDNKWEKPPRVLKIKAYVL